MFSFPCAKTVPQIQEIAEQAKRERFGGNGDRKSRLTSSSAPVRSVSTSSLFTVLDLVFLYLIQDLICYSKVLYLR